MSDINEVRERLARELSQDFGPALAVANDLRALLADHARLNELLGNSEQLAPAIDLEQFRMLAQGSIDALTQNKVYPADVSAAISSMRHLLALIDGQANAGTDSDAAMAAEYRRWIDFYHSGGSGAYGYEAFLASMQPTKGEVVAHD